MDLKLKIKVMSYFFFNPFRGLMDTPILLLRFFRKVAVYSFWSIFLLLSEWVVLHCSILPCQVVWIEGFQYYANHIRISLFCYSLHLFLLLNQLIRRACSIHRNPKGLSGVLFVTCRIPSPYMTGPYHLLLYYCISSLSFSFWISEQ